MFFEFPEVAGGYVPADLSDLAVAQPVKGCRVKKNSAGSNSITLAVPVPLGRARAWVQLENAAVHAACQITQIDDLHWTVLTFLVTLDTGPVFVNTPTDYAFSFGISAIPD